MIHEPASWATTSRSRPATAMLSRKQMNRRNRKQVQRCSDREDRESRCNGAGAMADEERQDLFDFDEEA